MLGITPVFEFMVSSKKLLYPLIILFELMHADVLSEYLPSQNDSENPVINKQVDLPRLILGSSTNVLLL